MWVLRKLASTGCYGRLSFNFGIYFILMIPFLGPKNRQVFVVGHSGRCSLPAATLLHAALVGLLGVVLSLLAVNEVKTTGLNFTVNEGTSKTGQDLLGLGVVLNLAYERH